MARRDDEGWELPASKAAGGLSTPSQVRADLTRPLGTHRSHRGHTGGHESVSPGGSLYNRFCFKNVFPSSIPSLPQIQHLFIGGSILTWGTLWARRAAGT